ncbi:MAG: cyclic nucleotide-binding/CBS domain-containing protein [Gammaproteobacteria bacterium]|nr:cyclic nucleotide-binding/CBS domain-containing protein [Gammaproteobacteria bacterium]
MHVEQLEIIDFLSTCQPFEKIPKSSILELVKKAETLYRRKDQIILNAGEANDKIFLIRKGAVVRKDLNQKIEIHLDAGSWFGQSAMFQKNIMQSTIQTVEDCLLYTFPFSTITTLMNTHDAAKSHFAEHASHRLRQAVIDYRGDSQTQMISSQIEDIKLRTSLTVNSTVSIIETAQLMAKEKRSAVLVIDDKKLQGIVTEGDFCRRVVAKAHDIHAPVSKIMTQSPLIIQGSCSASDTLLLMAKNNVHHLPFQRQNGEFSTITASDLIHFQSHNPLFLITDVYGALSVDELKQHSKKIPELLTDLVNSSLAAYDIGHLISSVGEAINQRLIQLAEQKLGLAPIDYAWLVAGSQGRMEQTAHSDQDNALIFSDDYNEELHKPYFDALAQFVCDGLDTCGYIYCPGNIMATNQKWQLTQSQWKQQFFTWIRTPKPKALLYSTIFFDMRSIYGNADLLHDVLHEVLPQAPNHAPFVAHIAANALQFSPPLGVFRNFVLEKGGAEAKALDLKTRGVAPVTDLARTYALASGSSVLNTQDRIIAAAAQGNISEQGKSDLIDAFAFISSVRLIHQCRQIEHGKAPDNFVSPEMLSSLERQHLKDAFDVVNTMQKHLRQRY